MDGPRLEHDLYRIQGRRNTDTATYSLISTVTLTTQVQRPLIIVRHPNESVSDYVWWRYCKHLRYVEDDNRLWKLLSYGTWHHRLVGRNGVPSQTKAPFKVTTVRTLNLATVIIPFFSLLPPLSPSLHNLTSFVSLSRFLLHFCQYFVYLFINSWFV